MSRDSATPNSKGETDELDTAVASTSLVSFRSAVAGFRFNPESPTLRRSSGKSRQVEKLGLCEETEYGQLSVENKSVQSNKRKIGEAETVVKKKKKPKRSYAEPQRYAHLDGLLDILGDELDVLFCGINPGECSATVGHHFANPTNHFWRCLFESGLTQNYIPPSEDRTLPGLKPFSLGLTNIVHRPTAEQSELCDAELRDGVPSLLAKITKHRPYIVCFVGLAIAKTVKAHCLPKGADGRGIVKVGFQSYKLVYDEKSDRGVHETLFYAMPSTSGRVVQFQREDKVKIMKEMKESLTNIKKGLFDTRNMYPIRVKTA